MTDPKLLPWVRIVVGIKIESSQARALDVHHFLVLHGFNMTLDKCNIDPAIVCHEAARDGSAARVEAGIFHSRGILIQKEKLLAGVDHCAMPHSGRTPCGRI